MPPATAEPREVRTRSGRASGRPLLAALAIMFTLGVVTVCVVDGLTIASPPRSNIRFQGDASRVNAVASGDILDVAGVLPGDEIVALNGQPLTKTLDLADGFRAIAPGERVAITVRRNGEVLTLHARTWPNLTPARLVPIGVTIGVLLIVGIGVYLTRPQLPATFIFLLFCLSTAINDATQLTFAAGSAWPHRLVTFAYTVTSLAAPAILLHLFLTFPVRGRLQRLLLPAVPAAYGIQVALGLTYWLPTLGQGPERLLSLVPARSVLFAAYGPSVLACYALAAVSLGAVAFSTAPFRVRQQARLLVLAFVILTVLFAATTMIPLWRHRSFPVSPYVLTLTDLILPLSVAAAVLFHRMFDINVLLRHGLVYGAATSAVAALFVALIGLLGWLATNTWPRLDAVAVAIAAAVAALAFNPARTAAQHAVDRLFYRRRYSYRIAVTEMTQRLATMVEATPAALYLRTRALELLDPVWIIVAIRRTASVAYDRIEADGRRQPWLDGSEADRLEAALRRRGGPFAPDAGELPVGDDAALAVPVLRADSALGVILLGPRPGDAPYLAEDRDFLATLAHVAGTVLERARLLEERSMRERLALVGSATSALAHELKNPLAAVKSTAAVLRRRLGADPRGAELTVIIEREIDRLQDTVREVLSFVRPPTRRPVPVDLEELLSQLVRVVEGEFEAAGVGVTLTTETTDAVVEGDSEHLRQAFLNLLLNAREAMPRGGPVGITLRSLAESDTVPAGCEVEICDGGSGFDDADLGRAFEPFYTTKRLGTGLGLSNVRRIVAEHGGDIVLGNRPEGGARVVVRLPFRPSASAPA